MNTRHRLQTPSRNTLIRSAALALGLFSHLAGADPAALPPSQNQGAIAYVTGGIGGPEADALKAEAGRYPLALVLTKRLRNHDAFLADVPVIVRSASGATLLDVVTEGPYLLVDLAPGRYEISATYHGVTKTARVNLVEGKHQHLALVWTGEESNEPQDRHDTAQAERNLPPMRSYQGVNYLSGGIGSPESDAIRAQFARHALALTFAHDGATRREYLASVPVVIRDATGTVVLDVITEGPYLLVDLPAGEYVMSATHGGKEKREKLRIVAGQHQQRALLWADDSATRP